MLQPSSNRGRWNLKPPFGPRKTRLYQRVELEGKVMVHDQNRLFIAPLKNISAGGILIDKVVAIPVGHSVRVVVKSKALDTPIQATGTVVRVDTADGKGVAVEFANISRTDRNHIKNAVFARLAENKFGACAK